MTTKTFGVVFKLENESLALSKQLRAENEIANTEAMALQKRYMDEANTIVETHMKSAREMIVRILALQGIENPEAAYDSGLWRVDLNYVEADVAVLFAIASDKPAPGLPLAMQQPLGSA